MQPKFTPCGLNTRLPRTVSETPFFVNIADMPEVSLTNQRERKTSSGRRADLAKPDLAVLRRVHPRRVPHLIVAGLPAPTRNEDPPFAVSAKPSLDHLRCGRCGGQIATSAP